MVDAHKTAWSSFMAKDFLRAHRLFSFVDELQKEIGPRTKVNIHTLQTNTLWTIFTTNEIERVNALQLALRLSLFSFQVSDLPYDFGESEVGDIAARRLKERCSYLLKNPPSKKWDGAEELKDKHF